MAGAENLLKPKLRIFPGLGDIIDNKGDEEHNYCPQSHGHKHIEIAEIVNAFTADDGDEGGGAARRMEGFGQVHGGNGNRNRHRRGQPRLSTNPEMGGNPDTG